MPIEDLGTGLNVTACNQPVHSPRVLVAMSGGVDSSVAALLLQREGYATEGVTLALLRDDAGTKANEESAASVCDKLGMPFRLVHAEDEFRTCVIDRFCHEYLEGRTPNPCVECNLHIKFGLLQKYREEHGFDYVALGHYVRCELNAETGRWELLMADDPEKDQSYFLSRLSQAQLAHSLFPLGNLTKAQVRTLARDAGFACAHRAESQDICFVPHGDYAEVLRRFAQGPVIRPGLAPSPAGSGADAAQAGAAPVAAPFEPGPIVDESGKVLGTHAGLPLYTIGQRKGIGVAAPEPLYVLRKIPEDNTLVVAPGASLLTNEVRAHNVNFVSLPPEIAIGRTFRVHVKTLYRQAPQPAEVTYLKEGGAGIGVAGADAVATDVAPADAVATDAAPADVCAENAPDSGYSCVVAFDDGIKRPAPGQTLCIYRDSSVQSAGVIV